MEKYEPYKRIVVEAKKNNYSRFVDMYNLDRSVIDRSNVSIAKELGLSVRVIQSYKEKLRDATGLVYNHSKRMHIIGRDGGGGVVIEHNEVEPDREVVIEKQIEERKSDRELKKWKISSDDALKRLEILQKDYEQLKQVINYKPERFTIKPTTPSNDDEATAIVQYSDWHIDEVVTPNTVNGLNEFNAQIAKERATLCFQNTLRVIKTLRSGIKINTLVIHLGGDFIGGYIHPELMQTNSMSPIEGIFYAKELLVSGIEFLLKEGGFTNIIAVTSIGNHSRMTQKMQYSNDYSMNLESFLYKSLIWEFKDEKRIAFLDEENEIQYLEIYGKVNRFFHGWQIKSSGGIGGIGIPLYKQLHRWNSTKQADFNFMCDKHCYSMPTEDCQLNGSLKGYDSFATSHGFRFQEPIQSLTLLDKKRGYTIRTKIICK